MNSVSGQSFLEEKVVRDILNIAYGKELHKYGYEIFLHHIRHFFQYIFNNCFHQSVFVRFSKQVAEGSSIDIGAVLQNKIMNTHGISKRKLEEMLMLDDIDIVILCGFEIEQAKPIACITKGDEGAMRDFYFAEDCHD